MKKNLILFFSLALVSAFGFAQKGASPVKVLSNEGSTSAPSYEKNNAPSYVKNNNDFKGFEKGDITVFGQVNTTKSNLSSVTTDVKTHSFQPGIQYFISDNISIGAEIALDESKSTNDVTITAHTRSSNYGIFSRYYLTPANRFSLYGQLSAMYLLSEVLVGTKYDQPGYTAGLRLGFNYFMNNNFSIALNIASLTYQNVQRGEETQDRKTVIANLDLTGLNIGIGYRF